MPKILVADPIGAEGVELLESRAEVDVKTGLKPPERRQILNARSVQVGSLYFARPAVSPIQFATRDIYGETIR